MENRSTYYNSQMTTAKKRPLTDAEKAAAQRLDAAWKKFQAENERATQKWLSSEANLGSQSNVGQYLKGHIPLNVNALLSICQVIKADPRSIYPRLVEHLSNTVSQEGKNSTEEGFDANVSPAQVGLRPIPVISAIQAGRLKEISDPYAPGAGSAVEYTDDHDLSKWAFALDISGESMLPDFREGDRIIVDPEMAPNPGDFVVARNGSEEATFKKYRPRGINASGDMVFELVPLNPDYPTMRSDVESLTVIGVMVEHRKKFRRKR